ncbi:MAG: hypothetical protein LAP21_23330 [Acidobacteriia bacterium]|nr:hypothetical protein [Terriglobia bacterium]
MSTGMKRVVSVAVIAAVLYVFISPLPEVDAAFSGKSIPGLLALALFRIFGLFLATLLPFACSGMLPAPSHDVLSRICVWLC